MITKAVETNKDRRKPDSNPESLFKIWQEREGETRSIAFKMKKLTDVFEEEEVDVIP